jgi:hypothetical protein
MVTRYNLAGNAASIYFLWVVKQVHNDSVIDWNRRPLVGAAATPARPSPWSGERTQHWLAGLPDLESARNNQKRRLLAHLRHAVGNDVCSKG